MFTLTEEELDELRREDAFDLGEIIAAMLCVGAYNSDGFHEIKTTLDAIETLPDFPHLARASLIEMYEERSGLAYTPEVAEFKFGYIPKSKIGAAIVLFARDYCLIDTPFNKSFINQLKQQVPPDGREWLPEVKKWRVNRPFVNEAIMITAIHFALEPA